MPPDPHPPSPSARADSPGPNTRCPACDSDAIVAGTFDGRGPSAFHPDGLRFWTLGPVAVPIDRRRVPTPEGVAGPFTSRAQACATCGLVWVHVDAERLRAVIDAAGKPTLRDRLARGERDAQGGAES